MANLALSLIHVRLWRAPPVRLMRKLALSLSVWSERYDLSRLDDATLRDIGLTRQDAAREGARALWDLPKRF